VRLASAGSPTLEPGADGDSTAPLDESVRLHILRTLKDCGWVVDGPRGAARMLRLHPSTLRSRMKKLGIRRTNEAVS
jgi:transcriptional regulator with GAF, ATPase, and Fis domain